MTKIEFDPREDSVRQLEAADQAQELFVPIHGHVRLYPEELAVVDHPSFQRLRRVRQLGFAHMVFPGAIHTRFEHSVGAVHVAQMIADHVNENFRRNRLATSGTWIRGGINYPTARFIRLGALLHDIGHLPFGHTLEDELHHLRAHDGSARISVVADKTYEQYVLRRNQFGHIERPSSGWSLAGLINALYDSWVKELGIPDKPFDLLIQIVCKAPKSEPARAEWIQKSVQLEKSIDLAVCRDVVGNTICADFLDYLFRDWLHIGKPLYLDKRLYQYMEVRRRKENEKASVCPESRFVINVGASEKIRHDALTDILELLNARYKLAETVLFHRTKLAITGLLDRCLLELGKLFLALGFSEELLNDLIEQFLLDSSDDGLTGVLRKLAAGGSSGNKERLRGAIKSEIDRIHAELGEQPRLYEGSGKTRALGEIQEKIALIERLIERIRDREVYTLAYKLRMCDFTGPHNPDNPRLKRLLTLYDIPKNRLNFLSGMEALCGLSAGSLIMYCPPDARMNAKVAKVNLFIEGDVCPFDEYESGQEDSGLTRGALTSQVKRFYELWSAYVFIEPSCKERLSDTAWRSLQSVIQCFFYQRDSEADLKIVRSEIDSSVKAVSQQTALTAFRDGFGNPPTVEKANQFTFPSGLPFDIT